eukprot:6202913-Pleurochrysis_carterae.AAC.1
MVTVPDQPAGRNAVENHWHCHGSVCISCISMRSHPTNKTLELARTISAKHSDDCAALVRCVKSLPPRNVPLCPMAASRQGLLHSGPSD